MRKKTDEQYRYSYYNALTNTFKTTKRSTPVKRRQHSYHWQELPCTPADPATRGSPDSAAAQTRCLKVFFFSAKQWTLPFG